MGKGLALNANNDIIVGGTVVTRTSGVDYLAQKIRSRLQLIQGESQLDTEAGLPYFTEIFVKPVDLPRVASLYKAEILSTDGILELLTFDYDLDNNTRKLTIEFSVNTVYGELSIDNLTINMGV